MEQPEYADIVVIYLTDDTVSLAPFRRCAERWPAGADHVFAQFLGEPDFSWARDGEALRGYSDRHADRQTLPPDMRCLLDALTVSVLTGTITALLNSTAGEAGKDAWKALTSSTKKMLSGRSKDADTSCALQSVVLATNTPALPDAAARAAEQLIIAAAEIPEYAAFLQEWHITAEDVVRRASVTTNIVTGNAQVKNLVQADTINTVTFG